MGLLSTPNPHCGLFQVFSVFKKKVCCPPEVSDPNILTTEGTLGDNTNVVVNRI